MQGEMMASAARAELEQVQRQLTLALELLGGLFLFCVFCCFLLALQLLGGLLQCALDEASRSTMCFLALPCASAACPLPHVSFLALPVLVGA